MSNYLALLNFNLTSINAGTINYSTLIGSTVIASSTIIANSTINVSSIVSRSINYSTIMGSTINANTVSIASTITTSSILATTNVGIGTNAPGYALDVGTLGTTGGIQIRNGSANNAIGSSAYPQIIMGYNGTSSNAHWIATRHNVGAGAGNAMDFYMWTSGQSATLGSTLMMSITSLGVGIGITNPSNLLTVGASAIPIANSVGTTNLVVNGNINCNRNRLIFSDALTDRNHCIYNNSYNLDNEGVWDGMKFNVFNGAWFRVGNGSGAVPTTALYINSTGIVGIGTTTPIGALSVLLNGLGTNTPNGSNTWDVGYALFGPGVNSTTGSAVALTYNTASNYGCLVCLTPGVAWRDMHYSANSHLFKLGNSNLMTIDNGGNVVATGAITSGGILTATGLTLSGVPDFRILGGGINFYLNNVHIGFWDRPDASTWRMSAATNASILSLSAPTTLNLQIAYNNKLTIIANGNIGIGITNPGYTLHVVGSIYATGDITAFSDKRYKDNITPLTKSLNNLTQLTGYSYTRSDLNNKENIGLIAQEVKEVFPQAVCYDENQGLYSVNYGCLIAPVIQAIKELKQTVDRQDEIIKILLDHYSPQQ